MVNLGNREKERENSPPRHYNNLQPVPKWGQQRRLRCSKTDPSIASGESSGHRKLPEPKKEKRVFVGNKNSTSNVVYEGMREKVAVDLQAEMDRIQAEMLGRERVGDEREGGKPMTWKLRDRTKRVKVDGDQGDQGPSLGTVRKEFSVCLSRSEIEEDFKRMVGHLPPRRPMKRHKAVQKKLDKIFPGLWVTEITPDRYKVDHAETGKKK